VLDTLIAVSRLLAEVVELDINPLLADAQGVSALDTRLLVNASAPGGAAHFAIRPYPAGLAGPAGSGAPEPARRRRAASALS